MGFVLIIAALIGVIMIWKLSGLALSFLFHPWETGKRVIFTLLTVLLRIILILLALSLLGHLVK